MNFLAASAAGYTAKQILNFLVKSYPEMSKYIQMASTAGFTAEQISNFIQKTGPKSLKKFEKGKYSPSSMPYKGEENNPYIQRDAAIKNYEVLPKELKTAGKAALGVAGAYALKRVLPSLVSSLGEQSEEQPVQQERQQDQSTLVTPQNQVSKQSIIPEETNQGPSAADIFKEMDLDRQIAQISTAHTPDVVAKILDQKLMTPSQKKWLKEKSPKSLEALVGEFTQLSTQNPQPPSLDKKELESPEATKITDQSPQDNPVENIVQATKEPNIEQEIDQGKHQKNTYILPNGDHGKILSERNGIAKLDVNGEVKHRKIDDLVETDKTPDELADLYEKALHAIPKKDRSANLFWGGYDEDTNEFAYLPHGGALYIYKDVPEEWAKEIKQVLGIARTSGESPWKAWTKGDPSRGNSMFSIIERLKSREKEKAAEKSKMTGKDEKPEKEYKGKFQPVFSTFASQQEILKKRKQEADKKLREQERLASGKTKIKRKKEVS